MITTENIRTLVSTLLSGNSLETVLTATLTRTAHNLRADTNFRTWIESLVVKAQPPSTSTLHEYLGREVFVPEYVPHLPAVEYLRTPEAQGKVVHIDGDILTIRLTTGSHRKEQAHTVTLLPY